MTDWIVPADVDSVQPTLLGLADVEATVSVVVRNAGERAGAERRQWRSCDHLRWVSALHANDGTGLFVQHEQRARGAVRRARRCIHACCAERIASGLWACLCHASCGDGEEVVRGDHRELLLLRVEREGLGLRRRELGGTEKILASDAGDGGFTTGSAADDHRAVVGREGDARGLRNAELGRVYRADLERARRPAVMPPPPELRSEGRGRRRRAPSAGVLAGSASRGTREAPTLYAHRLYAHRLYAHRLYAHRL